jgi:hypothetical protein
LASVQAAGRRITDLSDCVWLFAEESANGLRFL